MDLQMKTTELNQAVEKIIPDTILVAYKQQNSNSYYLEKSKLSSEGNPMGFTPLSVKDVREIFSQVSAADTGFVDCGDIFPKNVLHLKIVGGDFKVVWWQKASIQTLKFDGELRIKPITIKIPPINFLNKKNKI